MPDKNQKKSRKKLLIFGLGSCLIIATFLVACCASIFLIPQGEASNKVIAKNCFNTREGERGKLIDEMILNPHEPKIKLSELPVEIPDKYLNEIVKSQKAMYCFKAEDQDRATYDFTNGVNNDILYLLVNVEAGAYDYPQLTKAWFPTTQNYPEVTIPLKDNEYLRARFTQSHSTGDWVVTFYLVRIKEYKNRAGQPFHIQITSELRDGEKEKRVEILDKWKTLCSKKCDIDNFSTSERKNTYTQMSDVMSKHKIESIFTDIETHRTFLDNFFNEVKIK